MRIHTCKTRAKEEDEYLPAVTAQARSTKDVHPALLQAAAAMDIRDYVTGIGNGRELPVQSS